MKIKKGDKVKVIYGKDKGKDGIVERVYAKSEKILLRGINIYKKHIKKNEKMPQGGVVEIPRPLEVSKVLLVCPKCGKTTRVAYEIVKGNKVRICKKCKSKL
ncbi:50S ribosomal protein L24 [Candidatus Roizmanbacteria bacterium]|nr:50S ribosomal protein L24 [Candidatus Roizmanbacteria bacterium]